MTVCDLNADLGESFGTWSKGADEDIIPLVTSANIACGIHASDPCIMKHTVELAIKHHVAIGAHPGYPDLVGFGRRSMALSPREIYAYVLYQIGALDAFCKAGNTSLHHVKPHGHLYNRSAQEYDCADAIAAAVADYDQNLILFGLAGSNSIEAAHKYGLKTAQEFFADRSYTSSGTLVPRTEPGACIKDSKVALLRTIRAVQEGVVKSISGEDIKVRADTVCLHGDSLSALEFARTLRQGLIDAGITVRSI